MFLDLSPNWIDNKIQLGVQLKREISTQTKKSEIIAYKHYIISKFNEYNILERAKNLYIKATADLHLDNKYLQELNELDQQVVQIGLTAEQSICKKRPSTDWSPPLHQASLKIRYWVVSYRGLRNNVQVTNQLALIRKELSEHSISMIDSNKLSLKSAIRQAKADKTELMKNHKDLCIAYLQERIKADSEYEHITFTQAAKRIANKEQSAKIFAELKEIFHQGQRLGISHIMVPDRDKDGNVTDDPNKAVSWTHITIPDEIENTLLNYSIRHFGQAQGSVFTEPPLSDMFGYRGTSAMATSITEGTPPVFAHGLSPGAITILKRISNKQQLPPIDDMITFDEFWLGIRKWKENTSTSPSTRHLGHYKVLQCSDGNDHSYSEHDPNPSNIIMQVYYYIALSALKSGNTLERWCNATTAMIEKIPGTPKINKLRVIHLYEADYNMLLKLLWARKLVWNCHDNERLNDGQAGSRPGRRALDIIIQKEMKYLYARLTRTTLASMDNDAKSCYDRIICNLAMMISKYYGMSSRACNMQSLTLQKMQFRLRTALGESVRQYAHTNTSPIHGSGQGSCASPCLWLLISSLLIDCLEELGGGMTLSDTQNLVVIKQWLDGYVDDTSLFTNLPTAPVSNIQQVVDALQHDMCAWATLLEASGGLLEISKCFYYILAWKFSDEGDALPMTLEEIKHITNPITIYDSNTKINTNITLKCVTESHRTLGAHKTMIGCEKMQQEVLQEKSDAFAAIVKSSSLSRRQARVAYTSLYMPAITYCLPAVNLSEEILTQIQCKAVGAFLPAMGYDHSFPRQIVYGPRNFGGLNLGNLYTEQSIAKITTLMLHLRANTTLGRIMRINLSWTQLYSGLFTSIFQSMEPLTYCTDNWFLQIRNFLYTIQGTLSIKDTWIPVLERKRDQPLMEMFLKSGLPPASIRLVNNWRLYFQVLKLSDITNAAGTTILKCYRKRPMGISRSYERTTKLQWPRQDEPGPYGFRYWMYCLKHCCGMDTAGQLLQPLGNWTVTPTQSNSRWETYMSLDSKYLFYKSNEGYNSHAPVYQRSQTCRYSKEQTDTILVLPDDAIPVDLIFKVSSYEVNHKNIKGIYVPIVTPPIDFHDFVQQTPAWSHDLLFNYTMDNVIKLQTNLQDPSNSLTMVSDGGLKNGQGTYGVVIADPTSILIQNNGIAHGHPDINSSFRAESYGMLCGSHTIKSIVTYHKLSITPNKKLQIFSDNLGLITRINKHLYSKMELRDFGASDIDLELQILSEIRDLRLLGFQISINHVKGHQDRSIPLIDLPWEAQLNIEADALATSSYTKTSKSTYKPFPANPVVLTVGTMNVTSKQRSVMHSAYLSQPLRSYMKYEYKWSNYTLSNMWWTTHGKAIAALSHNDRIRIQKFIFNRWATNNRQSKYFSHITPNCSTCSHSLEDEDHIIRCLSPQRSEIRKTWVLELDKFLCASHTHDAVRQAIMCGLNAWLNNHKPPILQQVILNASSQLIHAYNEQTKIGWNHFVRGRLSIMWANLAQHHMNKMEISSISMSSERWGKRIISINWIGVLGLWEQRNSEEHGDTPEEQTSISKEKLLIEAVSIQETDLPISFVDRDYLFRSIDDLRTHSLAGISNWIRNARHLIKTYKQKSSDFRKRVRYRQIEEEDEEDALGIVGENAQ